MPSLVDLEKAFDTIWIEGLIYKLLKKKFPLHLTKLIWNMVTGRSLFTISGTDTFSREYTMVNGLQQGTINSPILFNIFKSDVLRLFGPESTKCSLIAFADDLIVYLAHEKPLTAQRILQEAIDKIFDYYRTWKLQVNTSKCEAIFFRQSTRHAKSVVSNTYKSFNLKEHKTGTQVIPHKNVVRYLGIYLDERLQFIKHIETQHNKAKIAFKQNGRLFYSKYLIR